MKPKSGDFVWDEENAVMSSRDTKSNSLDDGLAYPLD
jgi:hypothetical protein